MRIRYAFRTNLTRDKRLQVIAEALDLAYLPKNH